MNKKFNKKGFTIVELVIVIAVIAILAAVLIPTFSNMVKKANLSADQQAVRQMNTVLSQYVVEGVTDIADAKLKLADDNYDANNYKPLSKDHDFFWIPSLNRVILADENDVAIYPEDLVEEANAKKSEWKSLAGNGNEEKTNEFETAAKNSENIVLSGTTNMMGASINLAPAGDMTIGGTASAPAVVTNFVSDEGSQVAGNTGEWADNTYYAGLISVVKANTTVTVENITISDAVIGDTTRPDSARAGIIAGQVANGGKLYIKNVTIENCVVFGQYRIGALVGAIADGAEVVIENVTIKNTTVKGSTIVAALFGQVGPKATISITDLTKENLTVEASEFNGAVSDPSKIQEREGNRWVQIGTTWYPALTDSDYWMSMDGSWDSYEGKSGSYTPSSESTN